VSNTRVTKEPARRRRRTSDDPSTMPPKHPFSACLASESDQVVEMWCQIDSTCNLSNAWRSKTKGFSSIVDFSFSLHPFLNPSLSSSCRGYPHAYHHQNGFHITPTPRSHPKDNKDSSDRRGIRWTSCIVEPARSLRRPSFAVRESRSGGEANTVHTGANQDCR